MNENSIPAADISVARLRAWLLHSLPDDELALLEQRLLGEQDVAEALQEAETDLFDDYARGRLSTAEHAAFEQHHLQTAAARERLRIARALAGAVASEANAAQVNPAPLKWRGSRFERHTARPRRRTGRLAVIGSALAAGLALFAVLVLKPESSSLPASTETATAEPYTVALLASVERSTASGNALALNLPADLAKLKLQAEIEQPEAGARYRLTVFDGDGKALQVAGDLSLRQVGRFSFVEVLLPAKPLRERAARVHIEAQPPATAFVFDWQLQAGGN